MPSIRIKGSAYSTLRDNPVTSESSHLETIFTANAEPGTLTPVPPRMQRSLPTIRGQNLPPEVSQQSQSTRRRRSGTTTSRIHTYCIHSSRRYPRVSSTDNQGRTSTEQNTTPLLVVPGDRMITMEGPQANVMVRSNGEPGLIGSVLSLPNTREDLNNVYTNLTNDDVHHDDVVEHLDVIDPQVATVSNLTNAANTILIPPLSWYSRKPLLVLSSSSSATHEENLKAQREKHFEDSLDRHVNDIFRRPSKFKRTMKGVWSFLKTPMGVITAIYGFLVVFWGAAIVLFVAKIINLHNADTQGFWVEVSSQIENGLFTVTGIGLIPSRVLDTYRIYWIWHYKRKTRKLRANAGLPQLFDVDDLPDPAYDPNYVHVLTEKEERDLHKQQRKFQHHQTWYRPHGTETHRAFPVNTALLICLLSDGNSIFQVMLCGTMWGLDRFQRPAWSTGILIPCSFLCGILAAVFIWRGGQKTKRVADVKERLQEALAAEDPGYNTGGEKKFTRTVEGVKDVEVAIDEHMTVPPLREKSSPP